MTRMIDRLESRRLFAVTPALYAAGGGSYLTKFDSTTGAPLATITAPVTAPTDTITHLAADLNGNIFGIDATASDIVKVDAATNIATRFIPANDNGLTTPLAVAADYTGDLYVIDSTTLYHYSSAGAFISKTITEENSTGIPFFNADVTIGTDGLMYLSQVQSTGIGFKTYHTVRYLEPLGTTIGTEFSTGSTSAAIENDNRYTFSPEGFLYSASIGAETSPSNTVINIYTTGGVLTSTFGLGGSSSVNFTVGNTQRLYVVTSDGGIDAVYSLGGSVLSNLVTPPLDGSSYGALIYSPLAGQITTYTTTTFNSKTAEVFNGDTGPAKISMTGAGTGTLITASNFTSPVKLLLTGTNDKSRLNITAKAASIREVEIDGALRSFTAPKTNITPNGLHATRTLSALTIQDAGGIFAIDGTAVPLTMSVRSALGAFLDSAELIKNLKAAEWVNANADSITAPSITSLKTTGPFSGNITLSAPDLSLKSASFAALTNGTLRAAGSIGAITVGNINTYAVFAGTNTQLVTLPTSLLDFIAPATIKSFVQKGKSSTFVDSQVAAATIGTIKLGAMSNVSATETGVAAETIKKATAPPLVTKPRSFKVAADSIITGNLAIEIITSLPAD